jgi:hypothetical protein
MVGHGIARGLHVVSTGPGFTQLNKTSRAVLDYCADLLSDSKNR